MLWQVWAASYTGTDWRDLGLAQRSGILNFTPIAGPGEEFSGYTVGTFIGMGRLAFLVIGNNLAGMEFNVGTFANHARRIWPPGGEEFIFPTPNALDDELALAAANIIEHMTANFRRAPAPAAT